MKLRHDLTAPIHYEIMPFMKKNISWKEIQGADSVFFLGKDPYGRYSGCGPIHYYIVQKKKQFQLWEGGDDASLDYLCTKRRLSSAKAAAAARAESCEYQEGRP